MKSWWRGGAIGVASSYCEVFMLRNAMKHLKTIMIYVSFCLVVSCTPSAEETMSSDFKKYLAEYYRDFLMDSFFGQDGVQKIPVLPNELVVSINGGSEIDKTMIEYNSEYFEGVTGVSISAYDGKKDTSIINLLFVFSNDFHEELIGNNGEFFKKFYNTPQEFDIGKRQLKKDGDEARCYIVVRSNYEVISGALFFIRPGMTVMNVNRCISTLYLFLFGFTSHQKSTINSVIVNDELFGLSEYDLLAVSYMYKNRFPGKSRGTIFDSLK